MAEGTEPPEPQGQEEPRAKEREDSTTPEPGAAPAEPAAGEPERAFAATPSAPSRSPSRLAAWARVWPYALIAFLFLATSPYHAGLNNPNEMVRVYMTKALADEGTMVIDKVLREWGNVDDKAIREGKHYSSKAPLQSLIGVPFYKAATPVLSALGIAPTKRTLTTFLRIFAAALPGIACAFVFLRWARKRALQLDAPVSQGTGAGLAIALGTMIYPYAITFTGHILAALTAGGCYLAIVAMSRREPSSPRWRRLALLAGAGAGASPFAEYPSALIALPAIVAALIAQKTARARAELLLLLTAGGAAPFVLGLWAHHVSWGSPFRTGYAFLENNAYAELHGKGFFGVSAPKFEAFTGSLFSPGTGLFFYSPLLIIGLAALVLACFRRRPPPGEEPAGPSAPLARSLAIAGLIGFILETLFISGHSGWRGGWTLGPRYIIAVAPLLSVWVIEALAIPSVRSFVASFGAVSIAITGFSAALYPHLSDVYTNPLITFVWPSYQRGESTYGIAHALGLEGGIANLFHVVPLALAIAFVAFAGWREESLRRRAAIVVLSFAAMFGIASVIPERDAAAAERENHRLWGFWEPIRKNRPPLPPLQHQVTPPVIARPPGLIFDARARWREAKVEQITADGKIRPCVMERFEKCRYGDQPWQYLAPENMDFGGTRIPLLFMHPISGSKVRATFTPPAAAKRVILRYGLTDASFSSDNKDPVRLRLIQGSRVIGEASAGDVPGLKTLDFALTSTAPLSLEMECGRDGARVFGFDLEMYR